MMFYGIIWNPYFFNGRLSFVLFLVFSREGQIKTENEGSTWKCPRIFCWVIFREFVFFVKIKLSMDDSYFPTCLFLGLQQ